VTAPITICIFAALAGVGVFLIVVDVVRELRRDKAVERRRALMEKWCFSDVRATRGTRDWWVS